MCKRSTFEQDREALSRLIEEDADQGEVELQKLAADPKFCLSTAPSDTEAGSMIGTASGGKPEVSAPRLTTALTTTAPHNGHQRHT